ncbi:MAG: type I polyketide synthase, partial [Ktedonobacteraceae bacterium]
GEVLCAGRMAEQPLLVGSLKTNIGHMEGAAGVAGLIKAVLCLKHGMIPAHLHFHTPNPDIPWQDYALQIPTTLMAWPHYGTGPHRAVVCSYGIAGTNSYLVVEEAPQQRKSTASLEHHANQSTYLLPLSAQTPDALNDLARRYLMHLEDEATSTQTLSTISATASLRRLHHDYRLAVISRSKQGAYDKLAAFLRHEAKLEVSSGRRYAHKPPKLAWIFPGQGAQWLGMGRDLLAQEPVFRATLEACDQVMRTYVNWSLLDQLRAEKTHSRLHEIDVVQPVLFAIEIALATLWRSWGIEPDVVIGHSMGEVAAAYIAGALSLEDAAWIICARSKLLLRVSGQGAMAVVELTLEQAQILVSDYTGRVSVAVSNSPHATVLSGEPEALTEILTLLEKQGIFGRLVNVDVASHSPQMDPLCADLLTLMQRVQPRPTTVPMFSTVNEAIVPGSALTAQYWVNNLRKPVLFLSAIQASLADHVDIFLEMSPHPLLIGAIRQTIEHSNASGLALASLQRKEVDRTTLLTTLGHLYTQGCEPNWAKLYLGHEQHVSLPTYPWQRQRYWNTALDRPRSHTHPSFSTGYNSREGHPILGKSTPSALHAHTFFWTACINTEIFPYLSEHCVHGIPILPGAAYLELFLAAASEIYGPRGFSLEQLQLTKTLFFSKGTTQTLQIILSPQAAGTVNLRFFSLPIGPEQQTTSWMEHAHATVRCIAEALIPTPTPHSTSEQVQHTWTLAMQAPAYYAGLRARGIQHGPLFQGITHVWQRPGEVMAQLAIPAELIDDMPGYQIHPALLDAILQGITPFLPTEQAEDTYVPVGMRQVNFFQRPTSDDTLWTHAIVHPTMPNAQGILTGDVTLLNGQGDVLLEILGFRLQSLESSNPQDFLQQRLNQLLYTVQWEPQTWDKLREQRLRRKNWLIFSESQGLGLSLAEHLRAVGAQCVLVLPGDTYQQLAAQQYILPPTDPQAFHRLFHELYGDNDSQACQGIVYLWGMLATSVEQGTLDLDQDRAESGLLHLLQAQKSTKNATSPRLWLVTSGVHAIAAQEQAASLLQAPLWGLGRVIVYEHQDLHCTLIDLDSERGSSIEQAATLLFREMWSDNAEDEVALRGSTRYVARLVRHHLPNVQNQSLFRADGTYLITGGLGGVGLRMAQWMVERGARHLALLGRQGISEETQPLVDALRATGAEIYPMQVDVSQKQQLACALETIRHTLPPLRGVFHAAVVLDDSTLL